MSQLGRLSSVLSLAAAALLVLGVAEVGAAAGDKAKGRGMGSITGTVTGADGKPAAGVTVGLHRAPPKAEGTAATFYAAPGKAPGPGAGKAEKPAKPAPFKQTTTDARGQFTFAAVPPGEYHVTANAKGVRDDRKRVKIKAGEAQRVELKLEAKEPAAK
jgi:hypothetical protein